MTSRKKPERGNGERKLQAVQRLMGGESLDAVARGLGVSVAQLSAWREDALEGAERGLKARPRDHRDDAIARLKNKLGEVTAVPGRPPQRPANDHDGTITTERVDQDGGPTWRRPC